MVRGRDVSLSRDGGYFLMRSALGSSVEVRRAADLDLIFREYDTFTAPYWLTDTAIAWRRKHPAAIFMREVDGPARAAQFAQLPKRGIKDFFLRDGHYVYLTTKDRVVVDGETDIGTGDFEQVWIDHGVVGFMEGPVYHFSDGTSVEIPGVPLKVRFALGEGGRYLVASLGGGVQGCVDGLGWRPVGLSDPRPETDPMLVASPGVMWLVTVVFDPAKNASVALVRPFGALTARYYVPFPRYTHSWDVAYEPEGQRLVFAVEGNYHMISVTYVNVAGGSLELA